MKRCQADLFSEGKPSFDYPPDIRAELAAGTLSTDRLNEYDRILVMFSGGKDSWASLLCLLEAGVEKTKLELWHHDVDGEDQQFMDWPCTRPYVKACAEHLGLPVYFSWKEGGFWQEMHRNNEPTAPIWFESPGGRILVGGNGPKNTRRKFPQVSADLSVRWCSSYLKIDVAAAAIRNDPRFRHSKILVVTGERAQESTARSKYALFEPHKADLRLGKRFWRHVDHWRPVHGWSEKHVWDKLAEYKIQPHPAYMLGWSRTSCMACIFGNKDQWASVRGLSSEAFERIARKEVEFGKTIHRVKSIRILADEGVAYEMDAAWRKVALSSSPFTLPIEVENWVLPKGAFGHSCGPA